MKEKRRYPRFNVSVKIQDAATLKTGWTRDLSLGGCLIEKSGEFDFLPMASGCHLPLQYRGQMSR